MTRPARRRLQRAVMAACTLAAAIVLAALAPPVRADEARPLTRIAFGSCAHQDLPQPIWDAILAWRPELFVFAGDNVYGDLAPGAANPLAGAYAKAARIAGYRALREQVPVLATWDDHDYGHNDAGGDFPLPGAGEGAVPRFLADSRGRPAARARGHLSRAGLRPGRHAPAGHPARHPELPLAARPDRPA